MIKFPINTAIRRIIQDHDEFVVTLAKNSEGFKAIITVSGSTVEGVSSTNLSDAIFKARQNLSVKNDLDIFEATQTETAFDKAVEDMESKIQKPFSLTLPHTTFYF